MQLIIFPDNTPDTYLPMQGNSASILARNNHQQQPPNTTSSPEKLKAASIDGSVGGSIRYPEEDEIHDDGGELPVATTAPKERRKSSAPVGSPPPLSAGRGDGAAGTG